MGVITGDEDNKIPRRKMGELGPISDAIAEFAKQGRRLMQDETIKCPICGSTNIGLSPETSALCLDCDWQFDINENIFAGIDLEELVEDVINEIPEGEKK